jgi:dienelactone hydrolase
VSAIVVTDLTTDATNVVVKDVDKSLTFDWVKWKGNQRLVAGATYLQITRLNPKNPDSEIVAWRYGRYMAAVDRDGKNQVVLFKGDKGTAHRIGNEMRLLDSLKADPDHVLAVAPTPFGQLAAWRVDIHTGAATMTEHGDDDTYGWDTDRSGSVVARYRFRDSALVIEGRAPGETKWSEITRIKPKDFDKELADFELLGPGENPGTLYVAVKPKTAAEGDTRSIHVYDFRTRTLGPPIWAKTTYEVSQILTSSESNALNGVCYWIDTFQCDFKDAQMQANLRGIAKYFHNQRNVKPLSWSDDGRWWLFAVSGPDDPGSYYLYDWTNHEMRDLGRQYDELPADRLGQMQRYEFAAHDGLKIPGYLTVPAGAPAGPLPLVVIPHGGPMARDYFDYDRWSQFIASRGYLVYQPNFRGSGGYGQHWLESGFGQWGGLMQDDVAEGVKALVADGKADASRICIFGASYGGYTALIQGAKHPDLYKCVVSWAGVSNLTKFVKQDRSTDGGSDEVYLYELKEIGDPKVDKDRLAKDSAITYANAYAPPVLLVHGEEDTRVKPDQSRDMERALKSAKRDVRLIMVPRENHSDWDADHEKATLGEVAAFIEAHIAPAKLTAPPAVAVATK